MNEDQEILKPVVIELTPYTQKTRHKKKLPTASPAAVVQAKFGSPDHPLTVAGLEIPCYVLEDGTRVLVQSGMLSALDMSQGTAGRGGGDRLAKMIRSKGVSPWMPESVTSVITEPIRFRTPAGSLAYGYEATALGELCDALASALDHGRLNYQTVHIAERAKLLSKAFRHVGIIAMIDEATGFQAYRTKQGLQDIVDMYIAKEIRRWTHTFPDDFYKELFRLKGWPYSVNSVKRPQVIGHITNDLIYERLAPAVLEELRRRNPRTDKGHRANKHHQFMTEDMGHPRLREHIWAVVALMRAFTSWDGFYRALQRAFPKWNETPQLDFDIQDF